MKKFSLRAALVVIAVITLITTVVAFSQSYAGLRSWADHHMLSGIWAVIWPLQVDAFILIGELALYVAVLMRWRPLRHVLGWAVTALGGVISILGNVGHVGGAHSVQTYATAAVPPLAATAGLAVGLQILKWILNLVAVPVPPVPVRIVTAAPGTAWRLSPIAWHMYQVPGLTRPASIEPAMIEPVPAPAAPARHLDNVKPSAMVLPPAHPIGFANGARWDEGIAFADEAPAQVPELRMNGRTGTLEPASRPATDGRDYTHHARWDEAVEIYAASGHTLSSRALAAALDMKNRSLATAVIRHHKNGD